MKTIEAENEETNEVDEVKEKNISRSEDNPG